MKHLIQNVIAGQKLLTGTPDMTVRTAVKAMSERNIGAILLVGPSGQLSGIFTERDVLKKVVAAGLDPDKTTLSSVMTSKVITLTPDHYLTHALHLMHQGNFRHVPIVDAQGKPVGVVSSRDALSDDLADYERETRLMDDLEEIIG